MKDQNSEEPSAVSKKPMDGFWISLTSSNDSFPLLDNCSLYYNGTLIINAKCEPIIVNALLPSDQSDKLNDRSIAQAFWEDQPLWVSNTTAVLAVSYLDVIGRFEDWSPFQAEIAQSWKNWDFEIRFGYGATLIKQKLGANCPKSLIEFRDARSQEHNEINLRAYRACRLFEGTLDDEMPF